MSDTIVSRIFDTMKDRGITQKQVAERLGIGQGTVAGWKQRNCPPPINYISDISDLLGVSIDYLVTGSNNPGQYKLSSTEQMLIRLFRTASEENQQLIFSLAIKLNDEVYHDQTNPNELLKTLIKPSS